MLKHFRSNCSPPGPAPEPFRIILKNTGELESEFSKLAPTLVFEQSPQYGLYFRTKRYFGFVDTPEKKLKKWLRKSEIGLIYSNTLTNSRLLEILSFSGTSSNYKSLNSSIKGSN